MELLDVDLHDDRVMTAVHAVRAAALEHEREHVVALPFNAWISVLRGPQVDQTWEFVAAITDGRVVGAGSVIRPLRDNTDKAYLNVWVLPSHQGQGVGSRVLQALESRVADRPSHVATVQVPATDAESHAAVQFAESHGFQRTNREIRRMLDLPVTLPAVADPAPYTVHAHDGALPDELVPDYLSLANLMRVDAPSGETDFEAGVKTPDDYRREVEAFVDSGQQMMTTLALSPDGRVVAFTEMAFDSSDTMARQGGTYVHRDHRGHGLGLVVKVAALRALMSDHPHITHVDTTNAETNAHMVAINEKLGFRPLDVEFQVERRS